MIGYLTLQDGQWFVKYAELNNLEEGTFWSYFKLTNNSTELKWVEDGKLMKKPLSEGSAVEFEWFCDYVESDYIPRRMANLISPQYDKLEKELLIKEYVKNCGELFTVIEIDSIRDGGTKCIRTNKDYKFYIDKVDYTLHKDYPTTKDNLIVDAGLKAYILHSIENFKEKCEKELEILENLIEHL